MAVMTLREGVGARPLQSPAMAHLDAKAPWGKLNAPNSEVA